MYVERVRHGAEIARLCIRGHNFGERYLGFYFAIASPERLALIIVVPATVSHYL